MPDRDRITRIAFWVAVAAILVVAAMLRGATIGKPIETGWHDLGVRQALAGRNFLTHGILETRAAMVLNGGPAAPDELDVYAHHPTLLPIYLAGVFAIFGDTLDVYRVALIAISLATIVLLMRLLVATHGRIAAVFGGWAVAVCPLSAFYATGGDFLGDGLNLFILAGVVFRAVYGSGRTAAFVAELCCYTLATFYDWGGVFGFGIPLADAIIRGAPRGGIRRGLLALLAGGCAFGVVYFWAHVVVPARFPHTDEAVGSVGTWTPFRVFKAMRDIPTLMHLTFQWFLASQLWLWTLPILSGAAIALIVVLIAAVRGRFRESKGRVLVLLLVPAVAFFVAFTGAFLVHTYAPLVLVPAIGAAAGAFASMLWRLGVLGRVAALGWAVWCVWTGTIATREKFEENAPAGMYEASIAAAARSASDALLVTYHPVPWVMAFYSRRNVVADVVLQQPPKQASDYVRLHPQAEIIYVLPPRPPVPWGLPDEERKTLDERYTTIERALETRAHAESVGNWRLYKLH